MLKCPECGSHNLIKFGVKKAIKARQIVLIQKYLCKDCLLVTQCPES